MPKPIGRGYQLVRAAAEGDQPAPAPVLYMYDRIGEDWLGGGISPRRVVEDLAALGDVEHLVVRVNSPGGDVFDGIAIYNALARFQAEVVVHIDGIAASIASLIALAGDRVAIAENAMVMVHRPWTIALGDAPEMRRVAGMLDKAWSSMLATYERRTGTRGAAIEQRVTDAGGEWWLTASEAVKAGFADETSDGTDAEVFGLAQFQHVPERLAASVDRTDPRATREQQSRTRELLEIAAPRVVAPVDHAAAAERRRRIAAAVLATAI